MLRLRPLFTLSASLLLVAGLGACGKFGKPELSPAQAQGAVQSFIDARNPVCQTFFAKWPVQITDYERRNNSYHAQRITALEAAGLVRYDRGAILPGSVQKPSRANARDFIATKVYSLTELGQAAYRSNADEGKFCYGKKVIASIASVTPVDTQGKEPVASVRFVYDLQDLAPWVATPALLEVFPTMSREIAGMGQETELQLVWRDKSWRVDPIASLQ
ncbi:MAG: hypothetical protein ACH34Y_01710 [Brachymonas sp.]|jgi:hypothetical protein